MIKLLSVIIFYGLMLILGFLSTLMVYVLVRFGKSKILAILLSAFYLMIMTSLYAAALSNFNQLPLEQFDYL